MLIPRYYQQEAHDAVISAWKQSNAPVVIEAATGGGKSLIIAMLAKSLFDLSKGKRVLCLAPSKELVEQNSEKYRQLGEQCSIYSASIGKSLRHQVVFATEGTFKKVAKEMGSQFAGVIIDECHKTTNTIKNIIEDMRIGNPMLRVCGLSATPYRLDTGFCFMNQINGKPVGEAKTRNPYFKQLVYYIGARDLIEQGYLTPAVVGDINCESYHIELEKTAGGLYKQEAFEGWGRETSSIVADIVAQSQNRMGVMIFAATVKHAVEIMASLDPNNSRMIGGDINTKKEDRERLVSDFKSQKYKYLVSVGTMTTGIDFTHVNVVAIMRATESISLFQQIIGRALRLHPNKKDALILDYAENIERLCPDGDIFAPEIKAPYQNSGASELECKCPECDGINVFAVRKNDEGLECDVYGYFIDLHKERVLTEDGKPIPAHMGRRCQQSAFDKRTKSEERCDYYWTSKECPTCDFKNDITARYCAQCKEELVNPNEKLVAAHHKYKKNPNLAQCDELLALTTKESISKAGNPMLVVDFTTDTRTFTVYYQTASTNAWFNLQYERFIEATKTQPRTIEYKKDGDFWKVLSFNKPTDNEVLKDAVSKLA